MTLGELNLSDLSYEQSNRILEVVEDVSMEINDPDVNCADVARMFAEDSDKLVEFFS